MTSSGGNLTKRGGFLFASQIVQVVKHDSEVGVRFVAQFSPQNFASNACRMLIVTGAANAVIGVFFVVTFDFV